MSELTSVLKFHSWVGGSLGREEEITFTSKAESKIYSDKKVSQSLEY